MKKKHSKIFFILLILGSVLLISYTLFIYIDKVNALVEEESRILQFQSIPAPIKNQLVEKEYLEALAYIVYDANNKKIVHAKNENKLLPIRKSKGAES
jgi:D-alanyl-D-alanine carboxypeptidase